MLMNVIRTGRIAAVINLAVLILQEVTDVHVQAGIVWVQTEDRAMVKNGIKYCKFLSGLSFFCNILIC